MATASDLISRSLKMLGVIASGESASAAEAADGLTALNDILSSWSNEHLMIYVKTDETLTLTASQSAHTMGASGDFDTVRPIKIENIKIKESDNTESPVSIITKDEWAAISDKTITSSTPTKAYIEESYPQMTINFWPVPTSAKSVVIYSRKPLTSFSATSDTVSLPPGFERALKYALAVELAPLFGKEPSPTIMQQAIELKADLKRTFKKEYFLYADNAVLTNNNGFNYLTGE